MVILSKNREPHTVQAIHVWSMLMLLRVDRLAHMYDALVC